MCLFQQMNFADALNPQQTVRRTGRRLAHPVGTAGRTVIKFHPFPAGRRRQSLPTEYGGIAELFHDVSISNVFAGISNIIL